MFSVQRSSSHCTDAVAPMTMPRRRSNSTSNCVIEKKRGFKPSDRFDPVKKEFLLQLGKKFWQKSVRKSFHFHCIDRTFFKNNYDSYARTKVNRYLCLEKSQRMKNNVCVENKKSIDRELIAVNSQYKFDSNTLHTTPS